MPAPAAAAPEAPRDPGQACAELLRGCARLWLEPGAQRRLVELLAEGPDWAWLLDLAEFHGLIPLLARHLGEPVPRAVRVDLWAREEANRRRNRAMAAELLRLLALLEAAGVPAIPFKGPALAVAVYGDLGLRQFDDLDLLLRPGHVEPALAVLEGQGYALDLPLPTAARAALLQSMAGYHLELSHPGTGQKVELHWKTDAEFPVEALDDPAWWAGLPTVDLDGSPVRGLAAPDLLLILCLHGSKHHWGSLGWLVDVAELLRQQPALDWDGIVVRARRLGAWRRFALGLHLAADLLDAPLPAAVADAAAQAPAVQAMAAEMRAALETGQELGTFRRLRFDLRLYDRPTQRLRFLLRTLLQPSPADRLRFPLPRPLAFLHPPLRLIRLLWKHGTKPFLKA